MPDTTPQHHAALSAEQIAALTGEQREAELKARLGNAYATFYGENRATLPEIIMGLQNFILGTSIPKPGGAPSSEATPPALAAAPSAPASAPKSAATTPPALAVSGLDRAVLALARKRTPAAAK